MKTIKIGGEVVIEYVTTLLRLLLYSGIRYLAVLATDTGQEVHMVAIVVYRNRELTYVHDALAGMLD